MGYALDEVTRVWPAPEGCEWVEDDCGGIPEVCLFRDVTSGPDVVVREHSGTAVVDEDEIEIEGNGFAEIAESLRVVLHENGSRMLRIVGAGSPAGWPSA